MGARRPLLGSENALETRVAAKLKALGIFNFHNDATVMPGIPDRYAAGGNWIEFKYELTFEATVKSFDRQRKWLTLLAKAQDKAWVCALIDRRLYFEPWSVWRGREMRKLRRDYLYIGSPFHNVRVPEDVDYAVERLAPFFDRKES